MNIDPWRAIGAGATGPVVTGAQYLLRARGHAIAADGDYGPMTAAAVTAFQSGVGLPTDGVIGETDWPLLVVSTSQGSTGDAVRAVQQFGLLSIPGDDPLAVDGAYGPLTASRVRFFQESWGLTADGVAGPATWSFLSTMLPGPRPWPLVAVGATQASNWRVLAAQHLLRAHGATIAADGVFGPVSGAAAFNFQGTLRDSDRGTTLGQLDWPGLIATVRQGDSGEAVRAAQTMLPGDLVADGIFGPVTDAATRQFQQKFAPPVDGVVGPETWHALMLRIFD